MAQLFSVGGRWAASLGLGLLSLRAAAQAPAGWALKLTPQHLVMSGFWLEAERTRATHPRQTLTLGPQLYWGPTGHPDVPADPNPYWQNRRVRGAGLQGQHRFYLGSKTAANSALPLGAYVSYSPQVQVFRLSASYNTWYEESGPGSLPYLVYGPVREQATVLRYGVAVQAGYQLVLTGRLLLDVYAGVGMRKSHYSAPVATEFRSGPSDYAHQGLYFPAGLKVGVVL